MTTRKPCISLLTLLLLELESQLKLQSNIIFKTIAVYNSFISEFFLILSFLSV